MLHYFMDLSYANEALKVERSPENYLRLHINTFVDRQRTYGPQLKINDVTIMIAALPKRVDFHKVLEKELRRQGLSYEFDYTEGITIGEKRQNMYAKCPSKYCIMLDDDDFISHDFGAQLDLVIRSKQDPDVIVYNELVFMDQQQPTFTLWGLDLPHMRRSQEGFFLFTPGPKMCIRTELARQVQFLYINKGEDMDFCDKIRPLLKTQVRLPGWHITYEYTTRGTSTNSQSHQVNQ